MDIEDIDNLDFVDHDDEENEEYDEEVFRDEGIKIVYYNKRGENGQCHPAQFVCR